jgi:forespore regulator of the sigma-K checkpoint
MMKYILVSVLLLSTCIFTYQSTAAKGKVSNDKVTNEKLLVEDTVVENKSYETLAPLSVEVKLQRMYLDGEISEEILTQTIWSMADFWAKYADWQLVDQKEGLIIFQKQIDDISPLLKANGYLGIDNEGRLTIYKGLPEDEDVIQSFFQIDLDKLESNLKEKLKEGIVILTKDRFSELLQEMKEYEIE